MFTINSFSISKLNNAEVTGFYINVQKAITTGDPTKLGLAEVLPNFGSTLQKLIDQVYTTTGSEFTAAMLEADVKRDQTYKRIRLRLQMVEVAEDSAAIKAVKDVVKAHLLSKYTSKVPQLPYQEESAILRGFIFDLNDKLGDDGIAALGLADDLSALEDANNAFIAAYNSRATERAEGDTGLTIKLRQEMYALYQQVCFITQYLANSTETANAEKATACQGFIAVLNVLLADAKKRYNQRISNGTGEEGEGEGGEGGSTNPDDSSDTIPDDQGGSGSGSGSGSDNSGSGSGSSTDPGNSQGSGSDSGSGSGSNTGNTDNSGSGNSQGSGSDSGSGSSGNTSDPNKPSEGGVVNGDEVSF
jgi:hypothetical protein